MKLVHIIPEKNRVFNIFRTNDLPCVTKKRQTLGTLDQRLYVLIYMKIPKVLDKTIDNVI